jgi:hypothetical protein
VQPAACSTALRLLNARRTCAAGRARASRLRGCPPAPRQTESRWSARRANSGCAVQRLAACGEDNITGGHGRFFQGRVVGDPGTVEGRCSDKQADLRSTVLHGQTMGCTEPPPPWTVLMPCRPLPAWWNRAASPKPPTPCT